MFLNELLKRCLRIAARSRWLQPMAVRFYDRKRNANSLTRTHPFDTENGTRTSGYIPGFVLQTDEPFGASTTAYGASQPSIIRRALQAIPDIQAASFLDLGCGKGRPLLVAAEFPFRVAIGIELSEPLAKIARENAAIAAGRNPRLAPIKVVTGDAVASTWPEGDLVLFLYNPFGQKLMLEVVKKVEEFISAKRGSLYLVYYNPVWAEVVDASPSLTRRFVQTIPYAVDEIGFGPDSEDTVAIWQECGNSHPAIGSRLEQIVIRRISGMRAEVAPQ